jgi:hypothetical protein
LIQDNDAVVPTCDALTSAISSAPSFVNSV